MQEIKFNGLVTWNNLKKGGPYTMLGTGENKITTGVIRLEDLKPEKERGRLSIQAEYRGTPEEIKKAERIMRRTMYRLRAAGVAVFGTFVRHEGSEVRNVVFSTEKRSGDFHSRRVGDGQDRE